MRWLWVLAEDVTQPGGERETPLGVDGDLVDARQLVLNRVLDGDDLLARVVQLAQDRVGIPGERWA